MKEKPQRILRPPDACAPSESDKELASAAALAVLENIYGGHDGLVQHMLQNNGVKSDIPEIQALANRLGLSNLPQAGN